MIIVGIDPGSGKSSPTGIAIIDAEERRILFTTNLNPAKENKKQVQKTLKDLSDKLRQVFDKVKTNKKRIAAIETFVMQGRGGQTLHELRGALMSAIPYEVDLHVIYNTTIKRLVGKNGGATKQEVALGVADFFKDSIKDSQKIQEFIEEKEWDILDALAIAISGYLKEQGHE